MESSPNAQDFNPDRVTLDVIEDVQRRVAQETGVVLFMPFVTNPEGHLVELVEEDVRFGGEEGPR